MGIHVSWPPNGSERLWKELSPLSSHSCLLPRAEILLSHDKGRMREDYFGLPGNFHYKLFEKN